MHQVQNLHEGRYPVWHGATTLPDMAERRIFFREWRKHRGLTLQRLADRLEGVTTYASLSRIERGRQPYDRKILEAVADALDCEPADLLSRDPAAPDYKAWRIINGMKPEQREQAVRVLEALLADTRAA